MRKSLVCFVAMVAMLVLPLTSWGIERFDEAAEAPFEKHLLKTAAKWTRHPLLVENEGRKAKVLDFAMAFCSRYQKYMPNAAMADFIKRESKADRVWDMERCERGYYVDYNPHNDYVKCDLGWLGFYTEVCSWQRTNGHSLVGVVMLLGQDGERNIHALLFYDYDPETRIMTPDKKTFKEVRKMIRKQRGVVFPELPKEGKDINVHYVEWIGSYDEDWRYHDLTLEWTGDGFRRGKFETTRML
ncbi:MAG: hypothetical protein J6W49_07135 [Paludibacteraceae bacterium]|nr:hypothetical protein [Paludibacteraceae bacterium]